MLFVTGLMGEQRVVETLLVVKTKLVKTNYKVDWKVILKCHPVF